MKTWIADYTAGYEVKAETLEEALAIAKKMHEDAPHGGWEVALNPYDSNNYNTTGEK